MTANKSLFVTISQTTARKFSKVSFFLCSPRDFIPEGVHHLQLDLLDRDATLAKLEPLARDITHVFYVTWVMRASEEENIRDNTAALRNLLGENIGGSG